MTNEERQAQIDWLYLIGFEKLADYMQVILERDAREGIVHRPWTGIYKNDA